MSERAYRNSSAAGYGALEFSAARTSDGVWFGLHDADLNRTSGTTGLPAASQMTWAQVQGYRNTTLGGNEPYYRLTDFLDTFAGNHVVILDYKVAWQHVQEWYDLLATYSEHRSRIVVKFSGQSNLNAQALELLAGCGYSSWGFYYAEDIASGALDRTQSRFSILGMDHTAPQSAWDAVLAYGKPVAGHIAGNLAAYSTSLAKGAHMVQCSGVGAIPAVGAPEAVQQWDAVYVDGSRIPAWAVHVGGVQVWP